jgi:hypothetical protein
MIKKTPKPKKLLCALPLTAKKEKKIGLVLLILGHPDEF